ncbi:MAG: S9 family peptidase [Gemmatimonadales bacterium]
MTTHTRAVMPSQNLPPVADRRPNPVVRHGEHLPDDYAWLRDREDPAVLALLEAENSYATAVLAPTEPLQEQLYREMLGRIKETDLSVPVRRGEYWYYSRTEEGKQYQIHCRRRESMASGGEEVLLDLNTLAEGTSYLALGDFAISDDATLLAYSLDTTGYRQYTLFVLELASRRDLGLRRERVTSVAWAADGTTLFYVTEDPDTKRSNQLWRQRLGGAPGDLVEEEADEAVSLSVGRTRSREWLVLHRGSHTTSDCAVLLAAEATTAWRQLLPRSADIEYDIDHHGDHFYLRINDAGRNFRLVRAPVGNVRAATLEQVLPHRPEVMLEGHDCFAGHLIVSEREAGITQLAVHRLDDNATHRIEFPEPAFEAYLHANPEWDLTVVRVGYQSLVTPASVYDYNLETRDRVLLKQQEVVGGYDASRFVSERLEAIAPDGTRVPVSLVRRTDVPRDGSAPCLLHGYGAYGYPYPVSFSSGQLSLLERGVVVAIAHVRGGGELGKPWHDAGRMAQKRNSFSDFLAVADHLAETGHVGRDRTAIEGGSAGGLLMGAVVNLAPSRFAAVLSQVPFVDVLNTMSDATLPLTVGEYDEWGNPEIAEEYGWMRGYCPYTNLVAGPYPVMLVRTSLNDSQVMFWEPAKYVARIRAIRSDDNPLLFLTNLGAGHGGSSGRYDRLREIATDYAFLLTALKCEPAGFAP